MPKKWYMGVDSVAREVKKPYVDVGNVARNIQKGYIGIGNVSRQFFDAKRIYLGLYSWNDGRTGSTVTQEIRDGEVYMSLITSGFSTDSEGLGLGLSSEPDNTIWYWFPTGTVIQYSFTGSRNNTSYCDYEMVIATEDGKTTVITSNANASNKTYTLTKPACIYFRVKASQRNRTVTMSITSLIIDGEVFI